MSKLIRMTEEYRVECAREFIEALSRAKMADGKISFTKVFASESRRATVYFTQEAWVKMAMLICSFDKEVAWHGLAKRGEDETKDEYIIYDILVYPQEVTGATVNTDQEEYEKWIMQFEDEDFFNIRMQGHSHVNMGVYPSAVDITHQEKILNQLSDDMFYIFMIWNKSFNKHIKVYDMKKNILFEAADIDVVILGDMGPFLTNAKEMVKNKVYNYNGGNSYGGNYNYKGTPVNNQQASTTAVGQPYNPLGNGYQTPPNKPESTPSNDVSKDKKGKNKGKGKGGSNKPKTTIGAGWAGKDAVNDDYPYGDDVDEYYECLYGGYGSGRY